MYNIPCAIPLSIYFRLMIKSLPAKIPNIVPPCLVLLVAGYKNLIHKYTGFHTKNILNILNMFLIYAQWRKTWIPSLAFANRIEVCMSNVYADVLL